jgi:hypothetical protein
MEGGNEQKVVIKCCFKAGLSATDKLVLVQKAYGNEALIRSNVLGGILDFETEGSWWKMMREVAVQNRLELRFQIAAVADLIQNDRRIASSIISESLSIPKSVVLRILKEDFGKRKLCARFCSTLLHT